MSLASEMTTCTGYGASDRTVMGIGAVFDVKVTVRSVASVIWSELHGEFAPERIERGVAPGGAERTRASDANKASDSVVKLVGRPATAAL